MCRVSELPRRGVDVVEKAYISNYRGNRGKIGMLLALANPF